MLAIGYNVDEAHYNYGVLLGLQGRWPEAAAAFRAAIAANPLHAHGAQQPRADCSRASATWPRPRTQYRQAVAADPQLRLARYNLGRMLLAARQVDEAATEFEKLREPQDAESPRYCTRWPSPTCRPGGGNRACSWRTRHGSWPSATASANWWRPSTATWRGSNEIAAAGLPGRRGFLANGQVRDASRSSADGEGIFEEIAADVGLTFTHTAGATGQFYVPEVMGAGARSDRLRQRRRPRRLPAAEPVARPGASCDARRARTGCFATSWIERKALAFTDVTAASGLGGASYGMGVATGDYDNDGDIDLYVTALGPNTLYRNNGDGTFADVTAAAGVDDPRWSTAATFVDYDRDGDLDLFVANYLDFSVDGQQAVLRSGRARATTAGRARIARCPIGCSATTAAAASPTSRSRPASRRADGAGLGVATGDYNGDGWLDLYVANDATPNQLWINQKDGTFVDEGPLAGVALNAAGNPEGSMGVASGDYDRDGDEDLFITNIIAETFALYTNDGRAGFDDTRVAAGLAQPTAAFTGFGTDWIDYDNDGWLDLFVANGAVNIIEAQRGQPVPFRMRNQLFRNRGTGTFVETSTQGGTGLRARRGRPRRGLRRPRQRRRHRHRRDHQQRAGAAVAQPRRRRRVLAAGAARQRRRQSPGPRRARPRRTRGRAAAGPSGAHRRQLPDRAGPDADVWSGRVEGRGDGARRLARRHFGAVRGR